MKDALLQLACDVGGPLLGLDTSTGQASLTLVHPATSSVHERTLPAASMPAEAMVDGIDKLLQASRCAVQDVRAIVVGLGPGSFTGLRVGLATAKGLAMGGEVPLYGVSSMEVLARGATPGLVLVVHDARRGDFYTALYETTASFACHEILAPQVMSLAAMTLAVRHAVGPDHSTDQQVLQKLAIVGDAREHVAAAWDGRSQAVALNISHGLLAMQQRLRQRQADDLATLVPHYVRTSSVGR